MTIWGKVIGGFAGFALGGPLGGLLGAVAGHAVDKMRGEPGSTTGNDSKQVAFTVGVIVLSAKMAKADGQVTREEVDVFKRLFRIPASEMSEVGKIFDQAKREASGFEPYAQQIADMFRHQPRLLEELLDGLFHIAKADGVVTGDELAYLRQVARIFRFDDHEFERIRQGHMPRDEADPYEVLGVTRQSSDDEIKSAYRKLIRETHPDVLIAQGLPQEFIDLANQKMATINAAYDQVSKERKL